jgi:branched-chain amino acid aminotransferase
MCCSHGLHYASSVFEGERAYGGEIFKCTEHSERLKQSAQCSTSKFPISVAEIDAAKRSCAGEERAEGRLSCARFAWRGSENDGRLGAEQQNPSRHRDLAVAEAISIRCSA